jgi:hypothetical protein
MFFLQCEQRSFAPTQNNRQNYSSVYSSVYNFWVAKWKSNNLRLIIASISWLQSALNVFLNRILNCLSFCNVSELFHSFR